MNEMQLPQAGEYFCNQDKTEIYKVTLAGHSLIWVKVLDFANRKYFENRPYGTLSFLKKMIAINPPEAYDSEKMSIMDDLWLKVWGF